MVRKVGPTAHGGPVVKRPQVFSPFRDEEIITDLPAFLREAADILSN
jgi:hypothetical protein